MFVGPMKKKRIDKLSPILKDTMLELCAAYVNLRQAAEWGMESTAGNIPAIKETSP